MANTDSSITDRTLSNQALQRILGVNKMPPLEPETMASLLRVAFIRGENISERIHIFASRLLTALRNAHVTILNHAGLQEYYESANKDDRLVVIATGDYTSGDLPVDRIANLRTTTIVGVIDGPCPALSLSNAQQRLNSIIEVLAWNVVQVAIFVEDSQWTICTMNGAIVVASMDDMFADDVRMILIPKLAAPVVPPQTNDFLVKEGQLDTSNQHFSHYANDFTASSKLWERTGVMLFHTPFTNLQFRNRYYKKIVQAFLDYRSGMSYGFLARQMAVKVKPAMSISEASTLPVAVDWRSENALLTSSGLYVKLNIDAKQWVVNVPEVWVMVTRSGCNKTNVDIRRDLLLTGLVNGKAVLITPRRENANFDCKPSYDTLTILSHAVGNAIASSILLRLCQNHYFPLLLNKNGVALAHWHDSVSFDEISRSYFIHGTDNPPVSCSTYQSAAFALLGKLDAVQQSIKQEVEFRGDIHVEPYHGINITGPTLKNLAEMVLRNRVY